MRIVLLGDTHTKHNELTVPDGDVLVHTGDACARGTLEEFAAFLGWFADQPHPHKIFVAGNHERCLELERDDALRLMPSGVTYLQDQAVTIGGRLFYGSPWQPAYGRWAFGLGSETDRAAKWAQIPDQVAVLITHCPPAGILDALTTPTRVSTGCRALGRRVVQLRALELHAFGHIHEGRGILVEEGRTFMNTAQFRGFAAPLEQATVIDLR